MRAFPESDMAMRRCQLSAAEHVTDGHPDKVCDQMADTIVTAALQQDPMSRVAMEVTGGHGKVWVTGEMTTGAQLDVQQLLHDTYRAIGHTDQVEVWTNIVRQSLNIAQGVDTGGAGDQGIMTGYAVNETPELMPHDWVLSRDLCLRLKVARMSGLLAYLRPDGKSQVTLNNGTVVHVTIACHHSADVALDKLREDVLREVVLPLVPDIDPRHVVINGTGKFVQGGFEADAGTTGRKLVVDNYGPNVEIGGGCYSGKDPSKVDRSAAHFCRMVAKSIVGSGMANEALVKVGYAIGVAEPTIVSVQTNHDGKADAAIVEKVYHTFDFRPRAIIERLGLRNMNNGWTYRDAAAFGHYGRDMFPWEQVVDLS